MPFSLNVVQNVALVRMGTGKTVVVDVLAIRTVMTDGVNRIGGEESVTALILTVADRHLTR